MHTHTHSSSVLAINLSSVLEQYHSNHPSMIFTVLLIHTGIGPVLNLRFSPTFSTIMWDPPSTAGVLSGLTYHLIVIKMNRGVVIINTTTTETSYPLSSVQRCTLYGTSVTAFSLEQKGDTMSIMEGTPGGECDIHWC